jgi:hypothetical protein
VKRQARPDRPSDLESPQLTEPIWQIVEQCWVQQPKDRPTAKVVCEKLSALLKSQRREYLGSSVASSSTAVSLPGFLPPYSPIESQTSTCSQTSSYSQASSYSQTSSHSSMAKLPPVSNKFLSIDTSPRHLEWTRSTTSLVEHSLASGSSGTFYLPRSVGFPASGPSRPMTPRRSNPVVFSNHET